MNACTHNKHTSLARAFVGNVIYEKTTLCNPCYAGESAIQITVDPVSVDGMHKQTIIILVHVIIYPPNLCNAIHFSYVLHV